jgi:hypothetical protein
VPGANSSFSIACGTIRRLQRLRAASRFARAREARPTPSQGLGPNFSKTYQGNPRKTKEKWAWIFLDFFVRFGAMGYGRLHEKIPTPSGPGSDRAAMGRVAACADPCQPIHANLAFPPAATAVRRTTNGAMGFNECQEHNKNICADPVWSRRSKAVGTKLHAAHLADNASACCNTFCTDASCKSGG